MIQTDYFNFYFRISWKARSHTTNSWKRPENSSRPAWRRTCLPRNLSSYDSSSPSAWTRTGSPRKRPICLATTVRQKRFLPLSERPLLAITVSKNNFRPLSDDSWLTVNPESLEEMLGDKFGRLDMLAEESEKSDIIPQLESFLNMTSDYEGLTPAATNGRKKSRKLSHLAPPPRKVSTLSNSSDASQLSNQISFDPDSFNTAMQGILGM